MKQDMDPLFNRLRTAINSKDQKIKREELLKSDYFTILFEDLCDYLTERCKSYSQSGINIHGHLYGKEYNPYELPIPKGINRDPLKNYSRDLVSGRRKVSCLWNDYIISLNKYLVFLTIIETFRRVDPYTEDGDFEYVYKLRVSYKSIIEDQYLYYEYDGDMISLNDLKTIKNVDYPIQVNEDLTPNWGGENNQSLTNIIFTWFVDQIEKS